MATWPTKGTPGVRCTASEKASALRQPVGQVRAQAGQLLRLDPQVRLLDVAGHEAELLRLRARDVQALQEERAALGRREDLEDLLRLVVADRLRPHDGHDLFEAPVVRGLGQDLLAQEPGGAREQHPEPRTAAARAQEGARLALQALDAGLHFLLGQMRELAELEGDVAVHDAHHLLGQVLDGGVAHGRARHLRRARPERVQAAQGALDQALAPRELEDAAAQELGDHLDRMLVPVRMHEQLVGLDASRQLVAGPPVDARDVARGRDVVGGIGRDLRGRRALRARALRARSRRSLRLPIRPGHRAGARRGRRGTGFGHGRHALSRCPRFYHPAAEVSGRGRAGTAPARPRARAPARTARRTRPSPARAVP